MRSRFAFSRGTTVTYLNTVSRQSNRWTNLSVSSCRCAASWLLVQLAAAFAFAQTDTVPDVGIRFQPPQDIVLADAHIVVHSGQEIACGSILIRDGRISAVGEDIEIPPGAKVVDCADHFLYPAFVDSFVEVETSDSEWLAGHWNPNVTPQHVVSETLEADSEQLESLREAGVAVLLAAPNSGIVKGQSCVMTAADLPIANRMLRSKAFQHLRLYPNRSLRDVYPNSPMGAVALVRQTMLDAQWYKQSQLAVGADPSLPSPAYNAALESLAPVLQGQQTIVIDGSNELYALRADRLAREFSLRLAIRGSGREYRCLDELAASNRTIILPVDFPGAPDVNTAEAIESTTLQTLMHWRLAPENPSMLEDAGVSFVITTDGLSKPDELLPNVRKAIEHGLDAESALDALTRRPAKLLGVEEVAGALQEGMLANILVTDGPLFDSDTQIKQTWVQGEQYVWNDEPEIDLRGDWELDFDREKEDSLLLSVSGDSANPKAQLRLATDSTDVEDHPLESAEADSVNNEEEDDKKSSSSKVSDLSIDGYRLSGNFDAAPLGNRVGAAVVDATILSQNDKHSLIGAIRWPDGTHQSFTASQLDLAEGDTGSKDAEDSDDDDPEESTSDPVACEANFPLGAFGVSDARSVHEWVLIKNATIWTCGDDGILSAADMLVHNGVIESVGRSVDVPEGTFVIDATGLHVSPGIIDCHSHMATDGGVNESAQAVTAEVRIGDFIDPTDITIYRQLAGGVTTSNILHGSANPIGGQNQVIKLRWGQLGEELKMSQAPGGIKFALGENVKQSNRGDDYTTRYPQTRMGVEQIMRDRFEAAKSYKESWRNWRTNPQGLPPRRDLELDALSEVLDATRWVHCHSYRQDEILGMLRTLEAYGITIGTLQHILEGYKVADAMAKHGAMGSSFSDWWAYKLEVSDAIPFNGAIMHRAGVVVSFNSDDRELARHLNHEAAKAMKYGKVSAEDALKFVTLNPAKQLRIEQYVGSLEKGKHADFVIWNRSPLSTYSMCLQTWIDGVRYFDREEDLAHREEDKELHRQLVQSIISSGAETAGASEREDPSTWWARHDEFCHHGHDDNDDLGFSSRTESDAGHDHDH